MPLAETASTLLETIVMNAVIAESEGEEKISLIESMLQDQTAIIVDILSCYISKRMSEARKALTATELNN